MARVLYDGLVEYEDKTPATSSQMAKDVVEFLNWAAEPEMDSRKKMGLEGAGGGERRYLPSASGVKRYKWSAVKTRKIVYNPPVPQSGRLTRPKRAVRTGAAQQRRRGFIST